MELFLMSANSYYGYLLVVCLILLETAGFPLPGEVLLVLAGAYAGAGQLSIVGIVASAILGALAGSTLGYWLGRFRAASALRRLLRRGGEDGLDKSYAFFARHGLRAVFFAQSRPRFRLFGAVLAGASEMDFRLFTLYHTLGSLTWAALVGSLGYFVGSQLPLMRTIVQSIDIGLVVALIVIGITFGDWRRVSS